MMSRNRSTFHHNSRRAFNNNNKRTADDDYDEPVTDDLEIAAAHAVASYTAPAEAAITTATATINDENEIDVDDDGDDSDENADDPEEVRAAPQGGDQASDDDDDDDDDDQSDVDLTEALGQMEAEGYIDDDDENEGKEGDPDKAGADTVAAPQTAHEVDGYHGSVQQVEQVLGTSLHVDAQQCTPQHTQPAGRVQHFMVHERIVVVQSLGDSPLLLEEGNLLVIKEPEWIPLGKILEVFGPVSQPMYSIRLPEPIVEDDASPSDESQPVDKDPWSPSGRFTRWVQQRQRQNNGIMVHYLPQQATLVDTHMLLAQRQRGCDASNMHDEEVNATELDFSDDERERQCSKQRRRQRGGRTNNRTNHNNNNNNHRRGQQPPSPASSATAVLPGGFHAVPQQPSSGFAPPTITPTTSAPPPAQESDTIYYD